MKIERIDDKTVKCFLSNEELDAYEISYKDFVARSDKAKVVMEEIIEQAEEEVGYQPPGFSFDLQIMMLPDQGMILTFSEKEPDEKKPHAEGLLECLKELKQMMEEKKGSKDGGRIELHKEIDLHLHKEAEEMHEDMLLGGTVSQESEDVQQEEDNCAAPAAPQETRPSFAVFYFPTLRRVCEYAAVLPRSLRIGSVLYQMGEEYYLYLNKGAASYERYSRACIQAMEFGEIYTAEQDRVVYLEEHGQCVVRDHAVRKLRLDA